jgi:hypothetical protein
LLAEKFQQNSKSDQADVCVKAVLDVLPIELDAPGADPKEDDPGEEQFSEGPAESGNQNLNKKMVQNIDSN